MSTTHLHPVDAGPEDLQILTKPDVRAIRTVRMELLRLAYTLSAAGPDRRAVLFLPNPKISEARLREEWRLATRALSPEVTRGLSIAVLREGRFQGYPHPPERALQTRLERIAQRQRGPSGTLLPRPNASLEILKILLGNWLRTEEPLTMQRLAEAAGMSYPTVSSALRKLGPAIHRSTDRRVQLAHFPKSEWARLITLSESARATLRFTDRSGQPRAPASLLRRFRELGPESVAVGGVFGAHHHYADLDLVGSPRLDLTVHAPEPTIDLTFVEQLDPGLRPCETPAEPPGLVLHFLRRREPRFELDSSNRSWADPVECLLDLHEIPFEAQAHAFLEYLLAERGKRT